MASGNKNITIDGLKHYHDTYIAPNLGGAIKKKTLTVTTDSAGNVDIETSVLGRYQQAILSAFSIPNPDVADAIVVPYARVNGGYGLHIEKVSDRTPLQTTTYVVITYIDMEVA